MDDETCPSFVKLLMEDDMNEGIRIPPAFSNELEGIRYHSSFDLITGDSTRSSNRSWRVKLLKKGRSFFIGKKSWPMFVCHYNLNHGDCLLFHLTGKRRFFVTPYGPNGSKKKPIDFGSSDDDDADVDEDSDEEDFEDRRLSKKVKQSGAWLGKDPIDNESDDEDAENELTDSVKRRMRKADEVAGTSWVKQHQFAESSMSRRRTGMKIGTDEFGTSKVAATNSRIKSEGDKSEEDGGKIDGLYDVDAENPYFFRTIKEHYKYCVFVPIKFAKWMNLDTAGEILLRWEDGDHSKTWKAAMVIRQGGKRFDIGTGWTAFRRDTGIKVGDTCCFSVVSRRDPIIMSVRIHH